MKTITNQDFDTNNVNDLLSDGQYSYIHRKKGKSEEYHNLTDNIKTISSDNTDLLAVTNNNKTNNTATLHPKHDAQKEQVLESTRNTVSIHHGTNGTDEKTTVDTNPQKVLEHDNLVSGSEYITIEHEENSNTSEIKTDKLKSDIEELYKKTSNIGVRNLLLNTNQGKTNWSWDTSNGGTTAENYNVDGVNGVKLTSTLDTSPSWHYIRFNGLQRNLIEPNTKYTLSFDVKPNVDVTFTVGLTLGDWTNSLTDIVSMNKAKANQWNKVSCVLTSNATLPEVSQQIVSLQDMPTTNGNWVIIKNIKLEKGVIPSDWSPAPEDLYYYLAQKQNSLTSSASIGVLQNNTLCQLYTSKNEYTHANGVLKTYTKLIASNTTVETLKEEFNFTLKIKQGTQEVTFTLNEQDKTHFSKVIRAYGMENSVLINGCLFTLSNSTLTVTTDTNTGSNLVITFSDII